MAEKNFKMVTVAGVRYRPEDVPEKPVEVTAVVVEPVPVEPVVEQKKEPEPTVVATRRPPKQ